MEIICAPIEQWPGKRTSRPERSRFKSNWTDTNELLNRELRYLGARQIVMQMDVTAGDIRLDGQIRANARPKSSAVILAFNSKNGPMQFPCDRFDRWQDNVRAIALSLEALRKVDRYGVTRNNEQYKGWTKLPPPAQSVYDDANDAIWLAGFLEVPYANLNNRESLMAAIKRAERKAHPDAGGNASDFKRIQELKSRI